MLRELADGERTVSQLAEPFSISLAAASKHIKALEHAGLIRREVRGRVHMCRLDPGLLASAHEWLGFYRRFWTDRLDTLERLMRRRMPAPRSRPPHPRPRRRSMTEACYSRRSWRGHRTRYVELRRLLPGPIERCWAWLTDSELRRQWLAAGDMEMKAGAFEFVWRNDELTDPPGQRPEGFSAENRTQMRMIEVDPPHSLTFEWPDTGHVTFALEQRGDKVELT